MSKYATKAAGNMFCQARYEAAKFNERLSSREGAAEELGVDRTRLARIELGSVIPYPEEVLLMADIYRAPELKGNYCREMCPLGKGMPKIENQDIDRIALRALCSFRKINEAKKMEAMGIPEGTLPTGWWIGFQVTDADVWEKVKDGTYSMFSIEGEAKRVEVEDEESDQ